MNLLNRTYYLYGTLLIIAAMGITSCASTGMQRSQDTQTTMETMDNDIQEASLQIDATEASLDELMSPSQTEVKQSFNSYQDDVEIMVAMEKKFAEHAEQMKSKGNDYFKEWEKEGTQYDNPKIQQLSDQRRVELGKIFDKIAENSIGVTAEFKAYVSDIKEIQRYLSNNLTRKGIAGIDQISAKVVRDGESLKWALRNVQTAIQNAQAEMEQSGGTH